MPASLRWFFVPTNDRSHWDIVEARKVVGGWELRRPGKFGARTVVQVPVPGEDWVEAEPPTRVPKPPVVRPVVPAASPKPASVKVVVKGEAAAEAKPRVVPERPDRKAGARHTKPMPKLSRELMDLMAQAQRDEPAPAGMVKCPRCGVAVKPMAGRKVRTHDNPLTGGRCEASGTKLA